MRRQKRTNSYHTLIIIVLIIVLAVIIFVVLANTKTDWKRTNGGQGFFKNMNENGEVIKSDCLKYSWDINTKGVSDIKIVSGADVREGEMHLWIEHNGDRVFDDCYAVGHSDMEYYWSGNDGIKLTLHAEMADIYNGGIFIYDVYERETNLELLKEKITICVEMVKNFLRSFQ